MMDRVSNKELQFTIHRRTASSIIPICLAIIASYFHKIIKISSLAKFLEICHAFLNSRYGMHTFLFLFQVGITGAGS